MNHPGLSGVYIPAPLPADWYLLHRDLFARREVCITDFASLLSNVRDRYYWCIYLGPAAPGASETCSLDYLQHILDASTGTIVQLPHAPITWELANGLAIYLDH